MLATELQGKTEISWPSFTFLTVGGVVLYVLSTAVYRLWFHPLASQPGPLLGRLTSWYAGYQSYTGNIAIDIARCHEKYGDVVRYRPNGLLFNNVEGLHDIYNKPARAKKSYGYWGLRGDGTLSIINALDQDEHAPRRRLLSRAFSTVSLQKYEPLIYTTASIFCDSVLGVLDDSQKPSQWGPARDIGHLSSYFTFDVMSKVAFYTPKDLLTKPEHRSLVRGIDCTTFYSGVAVEQPAFVKYPWLKYMFMPRLYRESRAFTEKVKGLAKERVALGEGEMVDDIFGNLLSDEKGLQGVSPTELAADATVMIVAGTDTSSVVISAFFFYLARNPKIYAKLATEIRNTFDIIEEIHPGPKLTECKYLRACIDEAMRMAPSVAAPLWREMKITDIVGGIPVAQGTDVATCIGSIQRNPAYFKEPNKFIPERWLAEFEFQDEKQAELAKRAFVPFSLGSRGCIGKNLAYMEITTLLAQIMYRSDWKSTEGPQGRIGEVELNDGVEFETAAHFTSWKNGPFIQFKARDA